MSQGFDVLDIDFEQNGVRRTISPVLVHDGNSLLLVDTGFPGQISLFRAAIENAGFDLEDLGAIAITHHDRDHIGGLAEFVQLLGPKVQVLAHELEKPYVQGDLVFTKKAPVGQTDSKPSPDRKIGAAVTRTLADGERLGVAGNIVAIHVPGHTPGHVALYLEDLRTLITGDALNVVDGVLSGPNPGYSHDLEQAYASLEKLAKFDIRAVVSYHGGYLEGDINGRIAQLVRESRN